MDTNGKRLTRSGGNKWIAGVVGGIAEYFGWSADILRLIVVLVTLSTGVFAMVIAYVVLWLLMPKDNF